MIIATMEDKAKKENDKLIKDTAFAMAKEMMLQQQKEQSDLAAKFGSGAIDTDANMRAA